MITYSVLFLVKSQFPPEMFPYGMYESGDTAVLNSTALTITVTAGQTVTLPCKVQNPGNVVVTWFTSSYDFLTRGDQIIVNDERVSIDTRNEGEWTLIIQNIQPSDQDVYKCMLQTLPPQTKEISLLINVPPSIDKESLQERYLYQTGESLNLMCQVEGNPEPLVKWYAYKTLNSSLEEVKELVSSSSILMFEKLTPSDGGIYRCEAENEAGKDMYEVFLQEVYEPRLNTTMQTVGVKKHANAVLQCEIESNPQAKIGWQRNDTLLQHGSKYSIAIFAESDTKTVTELTIRHTEMSDSGEYMCVTSNPYGNSKIRFYVIVEGSTTTSKSTTTTITTRKTPSRTTKEKESTPLVVIDTEPPPGKLEGNTTPSEVNHSEGPKTGASLNMGYSNTQSQSYALILSTCTVLLVLAL